MFSLFTFINTQKSRIGINWASTLKRVLSHLPLFSQVFDIHQGGYFSAKVPTPLWASSELRKPRQYWRNHEGFPKTLKNIYLKQKYSPKDIFKFYGFVFGDIDVIYTLLFTEPKICMKRKSAYTFIPIPKFTLFSAPRFLWSQIFFPVSHII